MLFLSSCATLPPVPNRRTIEASIVLFFICLQFFPVRGPRQNFVESLFFLTSTTDALNSNNNSPTTYGA